jgi:RimJ/RimL family protein N-acetyltransferase
VTLDEEKYIGGCGINDFDWKNSVATVGIFIGAEKYRNKGYGTEAMGILLDFIFNQVNVNKVMLEVFSFNKRAISSYKKNGFVEEGRLRENVFRNGEYHDEVLMGLLRREYAKLKK